MLLLPVDLRPADAVPISAFLEKAIIPCQRRRIESKYVIIAQKLINAELQMRFGKGIRLRELVRELCWGSD